MLRLRPKRVVVTSQYTIAQVFPDFETQVAVTRRFRTLNWENADWVLREPGGVEMGPYAAVFNPPPIAPIEEPVPMDWDNIFDLLDEEPEPPANWPGIFDEDFMEL